MRLPLLLFGFTAVFATATLGEDDCRCWTPDAQQVAAAEAAVASRQLPLAAWIDTCGTTQARSAVITG
jgi:hypothetical protein